MYDNPRRGSNRLLEVTKELRKREQKVRNTGLANFIFEIHNLEYAEI